MRAAKQSGANQMRFFNTAMQAKASERASLRHELDQALEAGQLHVAFQPIIDLHTNVAHRAEALIRWEHPDRGDIPPDVFIGIAEQAGLIGVLGDIAFAASIEALSILRAVDPAFQISVNLSPVELREPGDRHARRIELVESAGIPGSAVIAEITEGTLLITDDVVDRNLNEYRAAGMQFAIDDFGTGYSSLAYLQRLDVQYLKIDQSFIEGLAPGSGSLALCQAIIVMASKLGLEVVAEGVETKEQNDLLTQSGCGYAQGYLHARPMSIDALTAWLDDRR
jgi:EAL domain-containing protein (putative c-di-GMP-specific phosphodiesterase class I)